MFRVRLKGIMIKVASIMCLTLLSGQMPSEGMCVLKINYEICAGVILPGSSKINSGKIAAWPRDTGLQFQIPQDPI